MVKERLSGLGTAGPASPISWGVRALQPRAQTTRSADRGRARASAPAGGRKPEVRGCGRAGGRVTVRAGSEPGRPGSEFPTTAQNQTPGPAPEAKKGARARRQEALLEERRGRGRCCCR